MARVTTSNYGAAVDTQFAWATTDADLFDREFDLYRLAQAVEAHDHSATRGLAVSRLAANSVPTAALQANAVTTAKIADANITNTKLAPSVVTRDKILWPLIQSANNMGGGFTWRDFTGVYDFGFYMAGNGLAVLGAGPAGAPGTNMILGQSGQVSVGSVQGAAKFNTIQTANARGSGIRLYRDDTSEWSDWWVDASARTVVATKYLDAIWIEPVTGYVTLGTAPWGNAKLSLPQASGNDVEGIQFSLTGRVAKIYMDGAQDLRFDCSTTAIVVENGNTALNFCPATTGAVTLGRSGRAWGAVNCGNIVCGTINSGAINSGAINAPTVTTSGQTQAQSFRVAGQHILPTADQTNVVGQAGQGFLGGYIGALICDMSGIYPLTTGTKAIGSSGSMWNTIHVNNGFKPGGGSWSDSSDDRLKVTEAFRDYDVGLDTVMKLKPVYYKYNGEFGLPTDREFVGFRAQHLRRVAPEMVGSQEMYGPDDDPNKKGTNRLTVDTSRLQFMLVLAIQELNTRLTALENKS